MLRLEFWNVLFIMINLIVLYLLMRKFLFGPVTAIIEKRKELIEQQLSDAQAAEQQALELKGQYEDKLQTAHQESLEIVDQAKSRAGKEYERIVEKANADANKIIEDAQGAAKVEHKKILSEVEAEIAGLAMVAAAKIVGEQCNDQVNQSLYDQFIVKAGELNDANSN